MIRRIWIRPVIGVLLAALWGCAPNTSVHPPAGWIQIDAHRFVFSIPPDMKPLPARGFGAFIGEYLGDSIALEFDYSAWSDSLENKESPEYASNRERIGGRKARIASFYVRQVINPFNYAIGVHFPKAGENDIRLTVFALCRSKTNYETATTIFRTIQFK